MVRGRFGYDVVYKTYQATSPKEISSLIVTWVESEAPLKAVIWHASRKEWMYAPAIAAARLFDDQNLDSHDPVDRPTAERIVREHLGADLPTETDLHRMIEEGHRTGHVWGPPGSHGSSPTKQEPN